MEEYDRREREERLRTELECALGRERERADREAERVRMEREKVCVLTSELARIREELNLCEAMREDDAQVCVCVCVCVCVTVMLGLGRS